MTNVSESPSETLSLLNFLKCELFIARAPFGSKLSFLHAYSLLPQLVVTPRVINGNLTFIFPGMLNLLLKKVKTFSAMDLNR